jgi:hypothetical protein
MIGMSATGFASSASFCYGPASFSDHANHLLIIGDSHCPHGNDGAHCNVPGLRQIAVLNTHPSVSGLSVRNTM